MGSKGAGSYEEKKEQTQETDLKSGRILQRKTLSRSCLRRKSGGKPPHSKMFGCVHHTITPVL
jgi:hypothetical protein